MSSSHDEINKQIQDLLQDGTINEDLRKLKIKRLKRKLRKLDAPQREEAEVEAVALSLGEYETTVTEFLLKQGLKNTPSNLAGYGFSLSAASKGKPTEPSVFIQKFRSRWPVSPQWFYFYSQGPDRILILGPVPRSQ